MRKAFNHRGKNFGKAEMGEHTSGGSPFRGKGFLPLTTAYAEPLPREKPYVCHQKT